MGELHQSPAIDSTLRFLGLENEADQLTATAGVVRFILPLWSMVGGTSTFFSNTDVKSLDLR